MGVDEQHPDVAMSMIIWLHFLIHTYKYPSVYIIMPRQLFGNVLYAFVYGCSF